MSDIVALVKYFKKYRLKSCIFSSVCMCVSGIKGHRGCELITNIELANQNLIKFYDLTRSNN